MKKKLIILGMAIVLAFTLSSCGKMAIKDMAGTWFGSRSNNQVITEDGQWQWSWMHGTISPYKENCYTITGSGFNPFYIVVDEIDGEDCYHFFASDGYYSDSFAKSKEIAKKCRSSLFKDEKETEKIRLNLEKGEMYKENE